MKMAQYLKISRLSPRICNFQTAHFPDCIIKQKCEEDDVGVETYIGVFLNSLQRRALVRCSLLRTPEDVPDVIYCDLRVQQLGVVFPESEDVEGNKTKLGREEPLLSSSSSRAQLESVREPEMLMDKETEANSEASGRGTFPTRSSSSHDDEDRMSHEIWKTEALPNREAGVGGRNDYSEIDLARHVTEMENESGVGSRRGGLAVAEEKFLFDELPSTVRFNDALACTSKDIQILKSGTIKMMRLTVICHSDLHYQNHTQKHHQTHAHSFESCFRNQTAAQGRRTVSFAKTSPSSFHSSTSSVQVTAEDGCERTSAETHSVKGGKAGNIVKCMPSSSHQHSNHDEHHFISTLEGRKKSQTVKSSPSSSTTTSQNWKRLSEKIRNIFQTYSLHVAGTTLVDLHECPLASFLCEFSPAIRFVFVEECEMRTTNSNSLIEIGKVSGKTEIVINNVHHISYYHRLLEKNSKRDVHLYGLEAAGKVLSSVIEIQGKEKQTRLDDSSIGLTEFSHGFLISGPSGCGKVLVVRETAKKVGAHLLSFNPVGSGSRSAQDVSHFCQQLTEIFMSALVTASRYPTVLLFPRIHLLFQTSNSPSTKSFGFASSRTSRERVLHHLCTLFDSIPGGLALSVVGTTDKAFLVPLQLRRAGRLEKEIIISPPKESERLEILKELSRDLEQFKNVDFTNVASQTPGYVGQDLAKLVRLLLFKCEEENCSQVSERHVKYALGRVLPSVLEGALGVVDIQRAISLDHIAGLHSVKLDLIKAIVWPLKHPEAFLRMGISPPKGILLYGPPGNCKTTLVRAVAASHQTNFLSVSAAELFSSGVGDSEKIVAHLFHRARMASPCILFIDELESIVGSRQSSGKKQTSTNESILSMLLTEMDGVGAEKIQDSKNFSENSPSLGPLVLVVAATNRPDLIDPALLRPGRFDKLIPVPPLEEVGRKELLEFCSKSIPFHHDVDLSQVAKTTEYYSGADLVNLCREAALCSLSEDMSAAFVTGKHVSMARSVVSPSLNAEMVRIFHEYGLTRKCC